MWTKREWERQRVRYRYALARAWRERFGNRRPLVPRREKPKQHDKRPQQGEDDES